MHEPRILQDNAAERTFDVFFYGLFMDAGTLISKGVVPREPRLAFLDGRTVKLGAKAMLLRSRGGRAFGMLYRLNHREMDTLYADVNGYRPEALFATVLNGEASVEFTVALSMVHLDPPIDSIPDQDPDYCARRKSLVQRLGIPTEASV